MAAELASPVFDEATRNAARSHGFVALGFVVEDADLVALGIRIQELQAEFKHLSVCRAGITMFEL